MLLWILSMSVVMSSFALLILVIWTFSLSPVVHLTKGFLFCFIGFCLLVGILSLLFASIVYFSPDFDYFLLSAFFECDFFFLL